jgi:hypothetical protein
MCVLQQHVLAVQAVQRRLRAVVRGTRVLGCMRGSCRLTAPSAFPRSGGTIPGTDVPWAGHGRPSCCAAGSSCRYVNNNFYQCQPNASG